MKAYIAIFYPSQNRPSKFGDYAWSHELKCYVYAGRGRSTPRIFDLATELKEFHVEADKALCVQEMFPRPTIRFIAEKADDAPADLNAIPVDTLIDLMHERAYEIKCRQLAKAREEKASKKKAAEKPPVPDLDQTEKERLESEGGITVEPELANA